MSGTAGARPLALDELDPPALTALLRAADPVLGAVTVTAVRAEPIGTATGFLGRLRRLHLDYAREAPPGAASGTAPDDPAHAATNESARAAPGATPDEAAHTGGGPDRQPPRRLVAKVPTDDPGGRQVGSMLNVWARESRFFAELAAGLGPAVPRCWANQADPAGGRWLLLLADAGDTTAADQHRGASEAHAVAALQAVAAVHRATATERPAPWLPGFDRGPLDALQHAVTAAVEPFLARFGEQLPAGGPDLLRRFAPRLSAWAAERARAPLVLAHADYRLDNLIVDGDGNVTILDWQTALMGPGTMDVASFLATSLTIEDRRRHEATLLTAYADATGHTVEHVRQGVRQHLLWWIALYANNLSRIDPTDPRGRAMFEDTVQRTFTAALDHDAGRLLERDPN